MRARHQLHLSFAALIACHLLGACTSWRMQTVPVPEHLREDSLSTVRLWLRNGSRIDLAHPRWTGDAVTGATVSSKVPPEVTPVPNDTAMVSGSAIIRYAIRRTSTGKTAGLILGLGTLAVLIAIAASCPGCGGSLGGY